jgi:hypothetical protein
MFLMAATLLSVRTAAAQGAASTGMTVSPVPMRHAVLPGELPAGASVAPSTAAPAGGVLPPSAGLQIIPTFDATITSDPNAAAIEGAINQAIANITSKFMDPITVNITFQKSGGLGQSSTYFATGSYAQFLASLKADAKTADDTTATGLLPNVAGNPVNGSTSMNVKTANLRAIGIAVSPPPGQPDGFIGLNTNLTTPGSPGSTLQYNLVIVAEHEIDEVLGLGSALPSPPSGTIFPEDLYRYGAVSTRSFTTSSSAQAFFSINASTFLAQFDNQNDGGDFGDWQSNPLPTGVSPKVQDAFATPGANPALGPELTALDVIGYDRVPATPTVTLKVNGSHPTPPIVHTSGPMQLTLDISPSSYTASVSWYWGLIVNGQVLWVTPGGVTSTPGTLTVGPPVAISNATLLNIALPAGAQLTSFFLLIDSSNSLVAFDYIEAVNP